MAQSTITTEVSKIITPNITLPFKEILLSLFLELTQAVDFLIPNKTYYFSYDATTVDDEVTHRLRLGKPDAADTARIKQTIVDPNQAQEIDCFFPRVFELVMDRTLGYKTLTDINKNLFRAFLAKMADGIENNKLLLNDFIILTEKRQNIQLPLAVLIYWFPTKNTRKIDEKRDKS